MPYSLDIFNKHVGNYVSKVNPTSVLDVGAGAGKYRDIVTSACPGAAIDAIEPFDQYINQFNLRSKYRNVFNTSMEDFFAIDVVHKYDIIMFGDVLEHLYLQEAIGMIDAALYRCRFAFLIWPTNLPQDGDNYGNVYEMHKCNFFLKDLDRFNVQYYNKAYCGYNANGSPWHYNFAILAGHTIGPEHELINCFTFRPNESI